MGGGCPFLHGGMTSARAGRTPRDWWPERLDLSLMRQHGSGTDPMGAGFDYRAAFAKLDYDALKADLAALMTDSKEWWPADWGHYGPLFVRMTWHMAGTYRAGDGRGGGNAGNQRFAPLNSWPDNGNLDKARRLLWPIKKKYGNSISWADLFILVGVVAIESMGGPVIGFGGGRPDIYMPEADVYWGKEAEWLGDKRYGATRQSLEAPLAAVQMGLIYVNPEGPGGIPDPLLSAQDIRETFARMAMNDEETVALVAGGHIFGKCHGAGDAALVGPEPEGAPIEQMGLGWKSAHASGKGRDAITSGIEGAWTPNPTTWDRGYFDMLLGYEWQLSKSPAGAHQWVPVGAGPEHMAPDAGDASVRVSCIMTTADMALAKDPAYAAISKRFREDHAAFSDAFARACFKLLHRDMGPKARYLGPDVPEEDFLWQDNVPAGNADYSIDDLKSDLRSSGLSAAEMAETAWASAATFRCSDFRGGANGARIRLEPQRGWEANKPEQLARVLDVLTPLAKKHGASVADTIVLAGVVAVEGALAASADADVRAVDVPFRAGRGDASQEQTDVESFAVLEPVADGFRNFLKPGLGVAAEELMVDRAQLLGLTVPEMVVLVAGLRSMGVSSDGRGLFAGGEAQGLSPAFLSTLMDTIEWRKIGEDAFEAHGPGGTTLTASRCDLIFGRHSELRAVSEVYAQDDAPAKFARDFVAAFDKVMENGRFD